MTFIDQFRLDTDGEVRPAYLFMTDVDDYVDGTWEPAGGENAVTIQPWEFLGASHDGCRVTKRLARTGNWSDK